MAITKRIFLLFCFALSANTLTAGDIKVRIVSEGQPLGYAYVFVNGRLFGAVSQDGITYLPEQSVAPGDTISASYVGMNTSRYIFNRKAAEAKELTIVLSPNTTLEPVKIVAKSGAEDLYRKYVKDRRGSERFREAMADFEYDISHKTKITGRIYTVLGKSFFVELGPESRHMRLDTLAMVLDVVVPELFEAYKRGWGSSHLQVFLFSDTRKMVYSGLENGRHMFTVVYPNDRPKTLSAAADTSRQHSWIVNFPDKHQRIFYADAKTRELVKIYVNHMENDGSLVYMSTTYSPDRGGRGLRPLEIDHVHAWPAGAIHTIRIKNIELLDNKELRSKKGVLIDMQRPKYLIRLPRS